MLRKPQLVNFQAISYYTGKLIIGLGFAMFLPVIIAFFFQEWDPAIDFLLGALISLTFGFLLLIITPTVPDLDWTCGMVVVSLSWLFYMVLGAIPLYLSGHFSSFIDASFESMSGFATTGLSLVKDLNHLSYTHNFWRHFTQFIGGQGIVVVALTFFIRGISGSFTVYLGEAREERILPNIVQTARFIWLVTFLYLIIGTTVLTLVGIRGGMSSGSSLFHGICLFMAAWDTGGFTPTSMSIIYYHSPILELVTILIFTLGALNFALHYAVWTGNRRELFKNLETRTFFFTLLGTLFLVLFGLGQTNVYSGYIPFLRKGFYQLISAHTGTGFMTIYSGQFLKGWNNLALLGIILAMSMGGCASSTAGAIKSFRVGILFKGLLREIRQLLVPEGSVITEKFHHIKDVILEDKHIRAAALITISYIFLYLFGAIIGVILGHPFLESLFESVSAAANVGHTIGITSPSMPSVLKVTYIFQMWAGRLEFISVFVLFGFLSSLFIRER